MLGPDQKEIEIKELEDEPETLDAELKEDLSLTLPDDDEFGDDEEGLEDFNFDDLNLDDDDNLLGDEL